MSRKTERQFIVRKFVMASSAMEAIKKERGIPVYDVFVDENWRIENENKPVDGFKGKK